MEKKDNFDLNEGGVKFDAGKIRLDLIPPESELAQAAVYTYGAIKYDDWNWAKGMRKGRLVAALKRHTNAYLLGEELDDESGLPHTWHMHCCTGMLIGIEERGVAEDDRQTSRMALDRVRQAFGLMKDPSGTVKNGGGTVIEEDAKVLGYAREGQLTGGLTDDEIKVLDAIDRMKELPFAGSKINAIVDHLSSRSYIDASRGMWFLTKKGYNSLNLFKKVHKTDFEKMDEDFDKLSFGKL